MICVGVGPIGELASVDVHHVGGGASRSGVRARWMGSVGSVAGVEGINAVTCVTHSGVEKDEMAGEGKSS